MDIIKRIPPISPFLEVKLEKDIVDYLWKIITISEHELVNHKQNLAGNISKSYLLRDIDNFFLRSVCLPLVKKFRESNLGVDPDSINLVFKENHKVFAR